MRALLCVREYAAYSYEKRQAEEIKFRFNFEESKVCVHSLVAGDQSVKINPRGFISFSRPSLRWPSVIVQEWAQYCSGHMYGRAAKNCSWVFNWSHPHCQHPDLEAESGKANAVQQLLVFSRWFAWGFLSVSWSICSIWCLWWVLWEARESGRSEKQGIPWLDLCSVRWNTNF